MGFSTKKLDKECSVFFEKIDE